MVEIKRSATETERECLTSGRNFTFFIRIRVCAREGERRRTIANVCVFAEKERESERV